MKSNPGNISEAQFSLIICGQGLCIEDISKNIGFEPTRCFHKGDLLNHLPEIIAQEDAWYHTIQLSMPEERDPALVGMLGTIYEAKDFLSNLIASGMRVTLRLSVNSDNAFMGYRLMPGTIEALNNIGLPLDVASVSWGEVTF